MEEKYRWIKVRFSRSGEDISVRQSETNRGIFFDADGRAYAIEELDFAYVPEEENALMNSYMKSQEDLRRMNEEHERTQNQLRDMLASMDAKAIADHQAVIDERAYWRKLRGDVFLSVLEYCGDHVTYESMVGTTKYIFDELYRQDKEYFKNLNNE